MVNELSGNGFNTPRGSLRSPTRVPSPALAMVAVTLKFSNPSTLTLEVGVLTVNLGTVEMAGAAETAVTQAMRTARGARRGGGSISMMKVPQAVGEAI